MHDECSIFLHRYTSVVRRTWKNLIFMVQFFKLKYSLFNKI